LWLSFILSVENSIYYILLHGNSEASGIWCYPHLCLSKRIFRIRMSRSSLILIFCYINDMYIIWSLKQKTKITYIHFGFLYWKQKLYGFSICWLWAYLIKFIPEMHHANYIWYLVNRLKNHIIFVFSKESQNGYMLYFLKTLFLAITSLSKNHQIILVYIFIYLQLHL
jgi:hypothetical protein